MVLDGIGWFWKGVGVGALCVEIHLWVPSNLCDTRDPWLLVVGCMDAADPLDPHDPLDPQNIIVIYYRMIINE